MWKSKVRTQSFQVMQRLIDVEFSVMLNLLFDNLSCVSAQDDCESCSVSGILLHVYPT